MVINCKESKIEWKNSIPTKHAQSHFAWISLCLAWLMRVCTRSNLELFIYVPITSNCCINRTWKSRALLWINSRAIFHWPAFMPPSGPFVLVRYSKYWLFIFWHGALQCCLLCCCQFTWFLLCCGLNCLRDHSKLLFCYRLWCKLSDWREWEFMNLPIQRKSLQRQSLTSFDTHLHKGAYLVISIAKISVNDSHISFYFSLGRALAFGGGRH